MQISKTLIIATLCTVASPVSATVIATEWSGVVSVITVHEPDPSMPDIKVQDQMRITFFADLATASYEFTYEQQGPGHFDTSLVTPSAAGGLWGTIEFGAITLKFDARNINREYNYAIREDGFILDGAYSDLLAFGNLYGQPSIVHGKHITYVPTFTAEYLPLFDHTATAFSEAWVSASNWSAIMSVERVRTYIATPEPSTWALLIAGFAMVGWALRRPTPVPHATQSKLVTGMVTGIAKPENSTSA